jgi:hypothetical protein
MISNTKRVSKEKDSHDELEVLTPVYVSDIQKVQESIKNRPYFFKGSQTSSSVKMFPVSSSRDLRWTPGIGVLRKLHCVILFLLAYYGCVRSLLNLISKYCSL